ncbi:hypothetical protein R3P38DRAFT_2955421 [Favolaschia claudopus]|uniref:Secreted protein n=1 Tax=Favolaschia claudopus TaxID=2862362 RepID=A0AAW0BFV6_9AGAR
MQTVSTVITLLLHRYRLTVAHPVHSCPCQQRLWLEQLQLQPNLWLPAKQLPVRQQAVNCLQLATSLKHSCVHELSTMLPCTNSSVVPLPL